MRNATAIDGEMCRGGGATREQTSKKSVCLLCGYYTCYEGIGFGRLKRARVDLDEPKSDRLKFSPTKTFLDRPEIR